MKKQYYEPSVEMTTLKETDILTASGGFTEGTESDPFTGDPWGV